MTSRRNRVSRGPKRIPGFVVAAGWLVLLLAALSFVTWRQTAGVQAERALRELETDRAILESERVAGERHIEELRSRARVVRVATQRLGMHLPADNEIIFLPVGTR